MVPYAAGSCRTHGTTACYGRARKAIVRSLVGAQPSPVIGRPLTPDKTVKANRYSKRNIRPARAVVIG